MEIKISKLLKLLKQEFNTYSHHAGLCSAVAGMHLNRKEYELLHNYLKKNRPLTKNVLVGIILRLNQDGVYWWARYKKEPRNKWLDKHIKKTLENEKTDNSS